MKYIFYPFCIVALLLFSSNVSAQNLIAPPNLQKGDTVVILAPAGIMKDTTAVQQAVELLHDWGLNTKLGKHVFTQNFHFAGTDKERLSDFQNALDDDNIKAIWCARGGYGTVRIIDDINFSKFKQHPKWIIGFSDVTVLHNEINNFGIQTMHAIMPITYKPKNKKQKKARKSFKKALFGKKITYRIATSDYNKNGEAVGQVVGGNLSLVYSVLGSKTQLNTNGKILFLEEVGEALYHIDRMMISLKRAGAFENCKGLIVGAFSSIKPNSTGFGMTYEEIILDAVKEYDFPVSFDFPAGHIRDNRTLLLGKEIILKVKEKKTVVKFGKIDGLVDK